MPKGVGYGGKKRTKAQKSATREKRVRAGKASVTKSLKRARKAGDITRSDVKKTRRSLKASGNAKQTKKLAGTSSQGSKRNFAKNLVRATKRGRAQERARGDATATVRRGSAAARKGQTVGKKLGTSGTKKTRTVARIAAKKGISRSAANKVRKSRKKK